MTFAIKKLKQKYPNFENEIINIEKSYDDLTSYFASIVAKREFSVKDMFFLSVVNRTNQCIVASIYCLMNDLHFPLSNIIRQMIEIYAVNEFIIDNEENLQKALFGKKEHSDEKLRLPNVLTIVQKLQGKEPKLVQLYDEYSELSHPNSRSVFSSFKGEGEDTQGYNFSMSSNSRVISSTDAYHLIRNIGGLANRIYLSTKKLNPLEKYINIDEFRRGGIWQTLRVLSKPFQRLLNRFFN